MDVLQWIDAPLTDRAAVEALLEHAAQAVRGDPGRGRQLAERARAAAANLAADDLRAQACYIAARACAMNAEHDEAIELIEEARACFAAAGLPMEMLRTNAGLMNILRDLGRYEEALLVGQRTLSEIDTRGLAETDGAALLIALVHQNAGLCYEQTGRYERALEAHDHAERHFRALGMVEALGEIGNNRAIVLMAVGRVTTALAIFRESAQLFADAGLTLPYATTLINQGGAQLLLGQFSESLATFEEAGRLFAGLEARADAHVLLLDTGDALLALNRYPEALSVYREAADRLRDDQMPFERARALWGAGTALLALHLLAPAGAALDEAVALFEAAGNRALLSGVLLERAALLARQGQHTAARDTAARALGLLDGQDLPVQQLYAHLRLADLHAHDLVAVERHLDAAQGAGEARELPHVAFRLAQRLGGLRVRQGRYGEARELLEAAAAQLERLRGSVASEALRISFVEDKVAVYDELLRMQLDHGDGDSPWDALVTAERARARALADRLVASRPASAATGELSQLHADLHAAYTELLGGAAHAAGRQAMLRARVAELEAAIVREDLRGGAIAGRADPPTAAALRRRLARYDAALAYSIIGDEVLAFVAAGGELRVVRRVSSAGRIEPLLARLASQWERFASAPAFAERHRDALLRSTRLALSELHRELIAPLAPLLPIGDAPRLVIVPHGPLHQAPFHALLDGDRYLVDQFELSYAPSLMALSESPPAPAPSSRALLVGVADERIPLVEREIGAVAQHVPGARALLGEDATLAAVVEAAPGCAVLHLACHAIFRGDSPMFSALQLGDGWLTAMQIAGLDMHGALVALSACDSGRGRVYDGDEVLGLTRAFLVAGARALLSSLWLAQDASTAELMSRWYAALAAGSEPAAALRAAQLTLREQWPHPFYWAPFYVVGR